MHNIVKYLRKNGVKCEICSPHGPDIKISPNPLIKKSYGILSLLYYWHNVSKHLKNNSTHYDIIWLHQPFLLKNLNFKNCVVTIHTSIFDYNKIIQKSNYKTRLKIYYSLREKIERYCIQIIKHYVSYFSAVSPHIVNSLNNIGIPHEKIIYIPNGVDINTFKPNPDKSIIRKLYGISKNDIVFTYVGRITQVKQPFKLIKFFSKLSCKMETAYLVIVGDGDLFNATKQLASKLEIKKVIFLGYIRNEKLPSLYACSDYYIMTSIYEGQPITIFEAMASGLPPIVSNIPVLRDIVEKSNSGLVLDFNNIEESVNKTIKFIMEDNLKKHSKRARTFIEINHNWERIKNRYLEIFNKLLREL